MPARARPTLRTLGAALRAFRKARGLSQDRLANRAGIDRSYLGGVERAERQPSWELVERILATLDVRWQDFGRALDEPFTLRRRAAAHRDGATPSRDV